METTKQLIKEIDYIILHDELRIKLRQSDGRYGHKELLDRMRNHELEMERLSRYLGEYLDNQKYEEVHMLLGKKIMHQNLKKELVKTHYEMVEATKIKIQRNMLFVYVVTVCVVFAILMFGTPAP